MFCDNLISLRKLNGLSQEELAEQLNVSRQTLSKYETGESLPDIDRCKQLAEIFGVTLDDLVNYDSAATGLNVPPKGKHAFGLVTVGDKGQIVIPAKARKILASSPATGSSFWATRRRVWRCSARRIFFRWCGLSAHKGNKRTYHANKKPPVP